MKVGQYWVSKNDTKNLHEAKLLKSFNLLYLNSKQSRPFDSIETTIIHKIAPRQVKNEAPRPPKVPQENIMDWLNNF